MAGLVALAQGLAVQIQGQPWAAAVVTFIVICITTRLLTGQPQSAGRQTNSQILDARIPPAIPYWVPYLGHIPNMALNADSFLAALRKLYPSGAFSLTFLGGVHTVVFKPALTAALINQPAHIVDAGPASKHLVKTTFGYPRSKASLALYDTCLLDLREQYVHLMSEKPLGQMIARTADRLRHNIADFVTFNDGDIDQTHWERLAGAGLVEDASASGSGGQPVVEADLFELVRNFVAFTANPSLLGTDFVDNFPEFWQALWRLDDGFMALAMDLPAIVPMRTAIGARRARGFLFRSLDEFETALETHYDGGNPGPQWADLDNISALVQGRVDKVWRKHGLSIKQRAALDLALIWAMNANANPFIFWMVWRIYSDADMLARIREEIAPFIVAEEPMVGFGGSVAGGIETAARIEKIDVDGLMNQCPYLKAAYVESMRLDVSSWSFRNVREDTVISDRADENAQKLFLQAGTYAHGAFELHHTDPGAYEDPMVWRPERHIKEQEGGKKPVPDMGNVRPYSKSSPAPVCVPDRLDWGTLLIYTCTRRWSVYVQGQTVCCAGDPPLFGRHHRHVRYPTRRWRAVEAAQAEQGGWNEASRVID